MLQKSTLLPEVQPFCQKVPEPYRLVNAYREHIKVGPKVKP